MTKQDIKRIFGSYANCGRAVGLTRQSVYSWPDPVPHCYADRVLGACVRQGISVPADILLKAKSAA